MTSLADYFRAQAQWRQEKAGEHPEDGRNAEAAAALKALADYTAEAGQDEAGAAIDALAPHLSDGELGGDEARRAVARYGFGYAVTPMHHAAFLAELVVLCMEDAYTFAREHGEDPTETLRQFEREAAEEGVVLPRPYFERRNAMTEPQLTEAVDAYAGKTKAALRRMKSAEAHIDALYDLGHQQLVDLARQEAWTCVYCETTGRRANDCLIVCELGELESWHHSCHQYANGYGWVQRLAGRDIAAIGRRVLLNLGWTPVDVDETRAPAEDDEWIPPDGSPSLPLIDALGESDLSALDDGEQWLDALALLIRHEVGERLGERLA